VPLVLLLLPLCLGTQLIFNIACKWFYVWEVVPLCVQLNPLFSASLECNCWTSLLSPFA